LNRINKIIDDLPILREKAKTQIELSQSRQKDRHNNRKSPKVQFEIGDKVLLYDAVKQNQHSGKFESKWKGPYFVHDEVQKDVYKLRTLDGKILVSPYNTLLLKPYFERRLIRSYRN
jgi:hypothetical protein